MPQFLTAEGRAWDSHAAMLRSVAAQPQLSGWEFPGPSIIGGRVRAMAIHPTNPDVMYAAGVSGGVLKTTNGDGSVGAVDFLNPSTLYQQTQFRAIRKSTNSGATFSNATFGLNISDPAMFINPLVLDPSDPQRLWTSGNLLWRTDNGAGLWTQTSAPTVGMGSITALAVAQTDSDFVLAGRPDGTILRTDVGLTANANTVWASAQPGGGWVSWLAFDPTNRNIAYATYSQFGGGPKV